MEIFEQVGSAALPAQYITYQLISGDPQSYADNAEIARAYRVQVDIMSISGLAVLPDVSVAMTNAGFSLGPERVLPKDQTAGHFILSKDFYYLEIL
jgi:hypothetical protein